MFARFGPGGNTIYYTQAFDGAPPRVYSTLIESPATARVESSGAVLASISHAGELALLRSPQFDTIDFAGTLAVQQANGGAPRELAEGVQYADYSPTGALLVVRNGPPRARLELPAGTVLYESTGKITHPRISPDGQWIAFVDLPAHGQGEAAIALVDRAGKLRPLCKGWSDIDGLAWSPGGTEVAFTVHNDNGKRVKPVGGRALFVIRANGTGLRRLTVPTLVIHGTRDPMVNVSGGRATAQAIPGAELMLVDGMGHDLPDEVWPRLVAAIADHAERAERAAAQIAG